MTRRLLFSLLIIVLVVLPLMTSCNGTETTSTPAATATPSATTTTPTAAANWWDEFGEPQYGGELNDWASMPLDHINGDPGSMGFPSLSYLWLDGLFNYDWTVDPEVHPYRGEFVSAEYYVGQLAESWDQTDPTTVVVHIRQGVHWPDQAPFNGREFTAEDVKYNYDRYLGTGSGFTEPNPFIASSLSSIGEVIVQDQYTAVFKLKDTSAFSLYQILAGSQPGAEFSMVAREVVEQGFDDTNCIGTGPFMLTDFEPGSTATFSRNPDYYGYDERHPENQLPYVDAYRLIKIQDMTTTLAALRTGKLDMVYERRQYPSWQQVEALLETNPEMQHAQWPGDGSGIDFRCDTAPYNDIRVRKALQLAINLPEIAGSYYGGMVDGTPCGLQNPVEKEFALLYDDWPEEVKAEYSYDPAGAIELLAEAAADGVFEVNELGGFDTHCLAANSDDLQLLQVFQAYFKEVGVNMEIVPVDLTAFQNICMSGENDQMVFFGSCAKTWGPVGNIEVRSETGSQNFTHNNDPYYEALFEEMKTTPDMEDAMRISKEAELYALQQHWSVNTFSLYANLVWQPYVKGYNGEAISSQGAYFARFWIDRELKASMGY